MTEDIRVALARLQAENARLKEILQQHGITWDVPLSPALPVLENVYVGIPAANPPASLSPADKIALFRRLFRGRTDIYPQRWESQKGVSGYSPVCYNEWRSGVCGKPKVKCGVCEHRQLSPLTEQALYDHLAGNKTLGVYPRNGLRRGAVAGWRPRRVALLSAMQCSRFVGNIPFRQRCAYLDFLLRAGARPLVRPVCWERRLSATHVKERASLP